MGLETATKILELNPAWPLGGDPASQGDNHTRMLKEVLINAFPVGSVLMNTTGINPADYIGGTWVAKAEGRALVGAGDNGESTWLGGEVRGSETHQLITDELPKHTHAASDVDTELTTASDGAHTHSYTAPGTQTGTNTGGGQAIGEIPANTGSNGAHTHKIEGETASTGMDAPHNNVQPSEGVFVWERTA